MNEKLKGVVITIVVFSMLLPSTIGLIPFVQSNDATGEFSSIMKENGILSISKKANEKSDLNITIIGSSNYIKPIENSIGTITDNLSIVDPSDQTKVVDNYDFIIIDNEWAFRNDNSDLRRFITESIVTGVPVISIGDGNQYINSCKNSAQSAPAGCLISAYAENPVSGKIFTHEIYSDVDNVTKEAALGEALKYSVTWLDNNLDYRKTSETEIQSPSNYGLGSNTAARTPTLDTVAAWVNTEDYIKTVYHWPYGIEEYRCVLYQNSYDQASTKNYYVVKYIVTITPGKLLYQNGIQYNGQDYGHWRTDDMYLAHDIDAVYTQNSLEMDANGKYYDPPTAMGSSTGSWSCNIGVGISGISVGVGWTQAYESGFELKFQGTTTGGYDYVKWRYYVDTNSFGFSEIDYTGGANVCSTKTASNPNGAYVDSSFTWWVIYHKNGLWPWDSSHHTVTTTTSHVYTVQYV